MNKQSLLSLCHYYRGEVKCPFDSETERTQGLFWMFEELFVRHSLNDPTFFEGYKQDVARYIENHPRHYSLGSSPCEAYSRWPFPAG